MLRLWRTGARSVYGSAPMCCGIRWRICRRVDGVTADRDTSMLEARRASDSSAQPSGLGIWVNNAKRGLKGRDKSRVEIFWLSRPYFTNSKLIFIHYYLI